MKLLLYYLLLFVFFMNFEFVPIVTNVVFPNWMDCYYLVKARIIYFNCKCFYLTVNERQIFLLLEIFILST